MPRQPFVPKTDFLDGDLFIETAGTAAASSALWDLLGLTRRTPTPWLPTFVLADALAR